MIRALLLAGALLAAGPALAHRGHAVLTVVEVDLAANQVIITHEMAAHDVEPALVTIAPDSQPSLDDPESMRALQAYVAERFVVSDAGGPLDQEIIRTIADGDGLTLGYRAALAPGETTLSFRSALFTEVHPDMENQVNIRTGGVTRTLVFRPGDEAQAVDLTP